MSAFRKEFIEIINQIRDDPTSIIGDLEEQMQHIDGKRVLRIPGTKCGIQLREGKEAYEKAIEALKKAPKVPPLKANKGLNAVARDYLAEITKEADPDDVDSSKFNEILNKYGDFLGSLSNISEFGGESPKQCIINLLVQDGSDKTNVETFTSDKFKEIGLCFDKHKSFRFCTFILMATKFKINEANVKEEPEEETKPETVESKLRAKKKEDAPAPAEDDDDDDEMEEGVKSVKKSSKIVEKKGKKYKETTIIKTMMDGTTEKEVVREEIKE